MKCKVKDVIFPSGCEARAINLGNKNVKIGNFTGGTSVRSKNIFTDISRYPSGKHEMINFIFIQIENIGRKTILVWFKLLPFFFYLDMAENVVEKRENVVYQHFSFSYSVFFLGEVRSCHCVVKSLATECFQRTFCGLCRSRSDCTERAIRSWIYTV